MASQVNKKQKNSKKLEELFAKRKYFYGLGRRKEAAAQVRLYPDGKGRIYVNQKEYRQFFKFFEFQKIITKSLDLIKEKQKIDLFIKVRGGGVHGQAEAASLGLARAAIKLDPEYRERLKQAGLLTRDARVKERKKPGLKRARRAPQWQKR